MAQEVTHRQTHGQLYPGSKERHHLGTSTFTKRETKGCVWWVQTAHLHTQSLHGPGERQPVTQPHAATRLPSMPPTAQGRWEQGADVQGKGGWCKIYHPAHLQISGPAALFCMPLMGKQEK